MTRGLATLYILAALATLLAFAHAVDPTFVRELGDFVLWLASGSEPTQ